MNHMELRSYDVESCSHTHDFAQLVLPIKGSMELEISHQSSMVDANTGVYIAPNERHCFAGSQENLFLVLDLVAENHFLNKISAVPNSLNLNISIKKFIQFAHHYLIHNTTDLHTNSLVDQLLLNLLSKTFSFAQDQRIIKAKNWIDLHFSAQINVGRVAQHCHLSESQLSRLFRQHIGYGVAEYWRMKKLEKAQYLLSLGYISIEEIGFKIGYENLSAFSRRFSQVFGEPPSQWQKKALNAKKMRVTDN